MAKINKFKAVGNAYAKLAKAQIEFQKAVLAAADPDDGVRVSKITCCLADLEKLHGTLKAIQTVSLLSAGMLRADGDVEQLGGGNTPEV
jgi:hypothetical protein